MNFINFLSFHNLYKDEKSKYWLGVKKSRWTSYYNEV